jgi:hypothetical protein
MIKFLFLILLISDAYSEEIGNETVTNYDSKKGQGEFIVSSHSCNYTLEEDVYKNKAIALCQSEKTSLVNFNSSPFRLNGCEISYLFQCDTQWFKLEKQNQYNISTKVQEAEWARQKAEWAEQIRQIDFDQKQKKSEEERSRPLPIISAKQKCSNIGYQIGTDKHSKCVLELIK